MSQGPYGVTTLRDVAMATRDGVVLRADIYRPVADEKFPVILQRTPYDKSHSPDFGEVFALMAAARGYVAVIQDCRGRFASDGDWYPFKFESQDGYDAVEWAAALPYSTGKVGMIGQSYSAATQMLAAIATPPHLAGIFAAITACDYHDNWVFRGGAFMLSFMETWTAQVARNTLDRRVSKSINPTQYAENLPIVDYPLFDVGTPKELAPHFFEFLTHPDYDDFWKQWSIAEHFEQIRVPAYHVGGWYDLFLGGTLQNFIGIRDHGGSEAAGGGQLLTIGPWLHKAPPYDSKTGEVDFGPQARFDPNEEALRWYDHLLKGTPHSRTPEKPVKIFVMGENAWREEDDWPLARAKSTPYYLHSQGKANGLAGDGTLDTILPRDESPDHYVYDPESPVPTLGIEGGAYDQRLAEKRKDVLVYSTDPFKEDVEVTGPVSLELYASSSAVDTDFTAKLVDVWPNGFAQNLADYGVLRTRYRSSRESPEILKPGKVYKMTIDLWATSNVFLAGHRLRIEISSSNFPRFDRNLNTGADQYQTSRIVKATNSVFHDRAHPSALILPIVPR